MKQGYRRAAGAMLLAAVIVCSVCGGNRSEAKTAKAAEMQENQLAVVLSDGTLASPVSLFSISGNAEVFADGVKLRKKASSTSTVLELMYFGETVRVNLTKSEVGKGWYYLTRCKTGTQGYSSTKYILRY